VSAHVVVRPAEVTTASFQTFTVSVPNEKGQPNTALKVLIPQDLKHVTPTVKPGWTVAIEKDGEGENASIKSLTWKDGSIPAGFREDFTFSAQAPASASEIQWKAYQTYADGNTVAWDLAKDKQPTKTDGSPDFSKSGPFSVTAVTAKPTAENAATKKSQPSTRPTLLAGASLLLSLFAVYLASRKSSSKN
jgi:uncharacterized protein YcnI